MKAWCRARAEKEKEEGRPELPRMTQRYLEAEAAIQFGVDLATFAAKPAQWRAEMMAHVIIKGEREAYVQEKMMEWSKAKTKKNRGTNPVERQMEAFGGRPKWMI